MNRRQFFGRGIAGCAAISMACASKESAETESIPRRVLGRTGEKLSIIGFGGIVVRDVEQAVANDYVARAYDRGVNYYDVAPTYGDAQDRLGPALKPYRQNCFLACKTTQRDRSGAEKELYESLEKLQTDHFDLYQLHAISKREDVKKAFGPDGAMEVFLKAREQGLVRYLGFSAHSEEAALLAMEMFDFDTTLFPINFVCWHKGHFGPAVVDKARERNMGILALKALAFSRVPQGEEPPYDKCWYFPNENEELQGLALRFTLGQFATAAVPPGEPKFFWRALDLAGRVTALNNEEQDRLTGATADAEPIFTGA